MQALAGVSTTLHGALRSRDTLRWLAELRGLEELSRDVSSVEHIAIAEAMSRLENSIVFLQGGSAEVDPSAFPNIRALALLLHRHASLTLYIEAHASLEFGDNDFVRHMSDRRSLSAMHLPSPAYSARRSALACAHARCLSTPAALAAR